MFWMIHSLSFVLKVTSFGSMRSPGGRLFYQLTEDQHQLFLLSSNSQLVTEAFHVTPAANNAAEDDAASRVLYCADPDVTFS